MFRTIREVSSDDLVSSSSILIKAVLGGFFLIGGGILFLILVFAPALFSSWTVSGAVQFFFGILPVLIGLALVVWSYTSLKKLRAGLLEKKVLRIAGASQGILTVAKLALQAGIPVSKATDILNAMQSRGLAEVGANQDGAVCYRFYDLMGATV